MSPLLVLIQTPESRQEQPENWQKAKKYQVKKEAEESGASLRDRFQTHARSLQTSFGLGKLPVPVILQGFCWEGWEQWDG